MIFLEKIRGSDLGESEALRERKLYHLVDLTFKISNI